MSNTPDRIHAVIEAALTGQRPTREDALQLAGCNDLQALMAAAEALTLEGFGRIVTYSRKVFIPLTQLCRDVCHYCTFAQPPRSLEAPYLTPEQVLAIARAGATAGCKEALFTLGDKPELRYSAARRALDDMGYATTLDYLEAMARLVFEETGLLPHLNPGVMTGEEMARLRKVSFSMGIMLESASPRLCDKGGPHFGSPDKDPGVRLDCLRTAGELAVPFTSGILIGIGESRAERIESLLALRDLNDEFGHIQEVIIQNFRAKPDTKMADAPEPPLEEHLWTLAVARLVFGPGMSLQAPPNLQEDLDALVRAGVNDWGGVSPVTPDHVNPEAPWPHLAELAAETTAAGRHLAERLALAPAYAQEPARWVDAALVPAVLSRTDIFGRARTDNWHAGAGTPPPVHAASWVDASRPLHVHSEIAAILDKARAGQDLSEAEIVALFATEGDDFRAVLRAANEVRAEVVGNGVSYVVNRNINYTNICSYRCNFCAFAKGRATPELRGPAYRLEPAEVARIASEAWNRGATEVCMQGGIHPEYTGETYLSIVKAVKAAVPGMHLHAFSPLEIHQGATTLGMGLHDYLRMLKEAGLASLPGTAAEILDDEIRAVVCHDKLTTEEWLTVVRAAHEVGIPTTATIMYGHVERPEHWARHLLHIRNLQKETGGFTEFVPLAFVHMEAPMGRRGKSRSGPTLKEALLMHAVGRLALHPLIPNIQTSWVKMSSQGAALCLQAGANDLGGVLMYESITRSAGGTNGQEFSAQSLEDLARSVGRDPWRRSTLYERFEHEPEKLRRHG